MYQIYLDFLLIYIVNWVFHVWDLFRLFISFQYGLILSKCFLIGSVLINSITITFIFDINGTKRILTDWFVIIFFFFFSHSKRVLIYLIILSLIALFSFKTRKIFFASLIILSFDCFFSFLCVWFWFCWLFSTSIYVSMCWFIMVFGCVCFKKIQNFFLNTTHRFLIGSRIGWTNQLYPAFFVDGLFFITSHSSLLHSPIYPHLLQYVNRWVF